MKKIFLMMMLVTMILTTAVFAEEEVIHIYIDGERLEFPEGMGNPFISDESRTMVPVRVVSEGLGYDVDWDGRVIISGPVKGEQTEIILEEGSPYALVNGVKTLLDSPMYIDKEENRSYVPFRFVSEQLGFEVKWKYTTLHRIDILSDNDKADAADMKITVEGFTLDTDEFRKILEGFGAIQEEAGTGGNIQAGPYGYTYHHDNVDKPFADFGITIPSERTDLEDEVRYSFARFSDDELHQFTTTLKYMLGSDYNETIDSIASKLNTDIESTDKGSYYDTIILDGKSYSVDNLTVRYFQNATIFYVFVGY